MWSVGLNIFGTVVPPCAVAQGEEGSPGPALQVPPLPGWCSGLPRRAQGSQGSELSIPSRWSHQGRSGDGSATIGTTTARATKPGQMGTFPQDSTSGFSVVGDLCHHHIHPMDTPVPSPNHHCHPQTITVSQPSSARPLAWPLVPLLVFVHSQTRAKQKQIPQQLKVPFLRLG